jgi:hypothetical protein
MNEQSPSLLGECNSTVVIRLIAFIFGRMMCSWSYYPAILIQRFL